MLVVSEATDGIIGAIAMFVFSLAIVASVQARRRCRNYGPLVTLPVRTRPVSAAVKQLTGESASGGKATPRRREGSQQASA